MSPRRLARGLSLAAYSGLLVLIPLWYLWLAPDNGPPALAAALLVPLLLPAVGILQGKAYTHAWATFVVLLYFVIGIGEAAVPGSRGFGTALAGLSLVFMAAASFYARFAGRATGRGRP